MGGGFNLTQGGSPVERLGVKREHDIDDIKDEFVMCRALSHAWDYHTARRTRSGFEQVLVCVRCRTHKVQYLNKLGEIQESRYQYEKGYLLPGIGYLDTKKRGEIRARSLRNNLRRRIK